MLSPHPFNPSIVLFSQAPSRSMGHLGCFIFVSSFLIILNTFHCPKAGQGCTQEGVFSSLAHPNQPPLSVVFE